MEIGIKVAPIEDVLIMKLMAERIRDHFDAITIIMDSFEILDLKRFWKNSKHSNLDEHSL
jgi:hypothetical protein